MEKTHTSPIPSDPGVGSHTDPFSVPKHLDTRFFSNCSYLKMSDMTPFSHLLNMEYSFLNVSTVTLVLVNMSERADVTA